MRLVLSLLLGLTASILYGQAKGDDILGKWINEDDNARFEIYKTTPNTYAAKIIWLAEPKNDKGLDKVDKNNPDKNLRTRPIIGLIIFSEISFYYKNHSWVTKMYNPEKGIVAEGKITMPSVNELNISASKYLITITKKWKRYE